MSVLRRFRLRKYNSKISVFINIKKEASKSLFFLIFNFFFGLFGTLDCEPQILRVRFFNPAERSVDDEKIERNGIKFLLKQMNLELEIFEAVNGLKALDVLKEEIPEVDLFIPIKDYPHMNEMIESLFKDKEIKIQPIDPYVQVLSTPKYQAYLRISDGCNNCCSYCAIPLIRGKFISRPLQDIITEAKILKNKGIQELVVISQDTTKYGIDLEPKTSITQLLKQLIDLGFPSIRLLYLYPDEIEDDLIELIKNNQNVISPYFDIPLQHASNNVLKNMNRRGNKEQYIQLINKIRQNIPNAILRTTYIVGFPGETDDDFNQLLEFTKLIKFDHLGAFTYSKEEGTASYDFDDQIPQNIKAKRYSQLMKIQKTISYENNKKHINEIMTGIVTNYDKDKNEYYLRSYWNAPDDIDGNIIFKSNKQLEIGSFVNVKITNAFIYDLYGEYIENKEK